MLQPLTRGERQTLAFFIAALLTLLLIGLASGTPAETLTREGHVVIDGVIVEVAVAPCDQPEGRDQKAGAHFIVATSVGDTLNVHLGPAHLVTDELAAMRVGDRIGIRAFQKPGLPEGHLVAKALWTSEETFRLRDEETTVPRWAGENERCKRAGLG